MTKSGTAASAAVEERRIPFFQHDLGAAELEALGVVLRGPVLTTGETVADFERPFADYLGIPHAVGVTSCTAALHLALLALAIGPGDEVITTPMTFVATVTAILHAGARPVFVDVEPDTGNLDATRVEAAITPRTKALLPVHLYGQMCDMPALRSIADRHGLTVVEDAAHCVEGRRDGLRPGALSEAACFSFYATKSITCGEGGALITRDAALANRVRLLRLQGMTTSAAVQLREGYRRRDMLALGWKYNMNNLQAALLLPQLGRIAHNHRQRTILAERYLDRLRTMPHVVVPRAHENVQHAWHLFPIRIHGCERDAVIAALQRDAVGVSVHYDPPVHLTTYFRRRFGYEPGAFPIAEQIGASTLSLPLYATMPETHVDGVLARLQRAIGA